MGARLPSGGVPDSSAPRTDSREPLPPPALPSWTDIPSARNRCLETPVQSQADVFGLTQGTKQQIRMSNSTLELPDREIIERFNGGEPEAFDLLVQKHSSRAYQIAYGVLGTREDAEEVAQDVFVRVYRALPKFRGDSEFTTWMYRIAVNLARNRYRWNKSRGGQRTISIDAPIESSGDTNESGIDLPEERLTPDDEISLDEFRKNISEELQKLPPLYREALVLRNVENMSYENIASVLGCKLGTIKSRIARAREELRKRLRE